MHSHVIDELGDRDNEKSHIALKASIAELGQQVQAPYLFVAVVLCASILLMVTHLALDPDLVEHTEIVRRPPVPFGPLAQPAVPGLQPEASKGRPDTSRLLAPVSTPAIEQRSSGTRAQRPTAPRTAPTTVHKPAARTAEFVGTLTVESDPSGGTVLINAQPVGMTPLPARRLRAGSHLIWIEQEGYQRWTSAVRIPADQLTRVKVKLQPLAHR